MKAFAIYTALRLAIFVGCYAVLGWIYLGIFGRTGALVWPFLAALVVSALLSWKYLAPARAVRGRRPGTRGAGLGEVRGDAVKEDAD